VVQVDRGTGRYWYLQILRQADLGTDISLDTIVVKADRETGRSVGRRLGSRTEGSQSHTSAFTHFFPLYINTHI